MKTCPECTQHAWTDDATGVHTCPQCRTRLNLSTGAVSKPAIRHKFSHTTKAGIRAQRNRLVLSDGNVACALCARPHRLMDSVDGRIDTDGTMRVQVQDGWRMVGSLFVPIYTERHIPRSVRGQLCPVCVAAFPVKFMGAVPQPRDSKVITRTWNTREQNADRFPEWAHTGSSEWLTGRLQVSVIERKDGSIGRITHRSKHPRHCECLECVRVERPQQWSFDVLLHDLDMAIAFRPPVVTLPQSPRWTGYACDHVRKGPRAIRDTLAFRQRIGRRLTILDSLADAVRASIAAGDSMSACCYARMAARHPAAKRTQRA